MGLYSNVLFPGCYDRMMKDAALDARRSESLRAVRGETLEVGIGTGLNLPHYPAHVRHITAVDPNRGMAKKLREKTARGAIAVDLHLAGAENMPFIDALFDTVVTTHVLCSLDDVDAGLREIRRVLRPGGQLVFLEHGLSCEHKVRAWQRRLNPLQRLWGDGCRLDVPISEVIRAAGFEIESLDEGYLPGHAKTHGYIYQGVARR